MPAPAILEPLLPKLLLTGSEEQCSASEKIVTNKWFLIEQGVAIVLDIAALFSLVLACIRVRRKFRSLHPSVQILLFNMNVLIVLRTLVTFVRSSTNSYLWLAGKNPCDYMIDIVYCFILVRLGRTFYFALLSNFGMITVERLIATIWHKTYEHGRSKLLTFTLMVGSYFPNICMLYYEVQHFYQLINSGMHLVGYCTSEIFDEIFYNPYPDFTATAVMIAYSSFTLIGFCFVRVYNCIKMQNIGTALTGRYQLRENINTSSFVAPLAFVFTVLNLISIIIIKCFNWISATSDDKLTVFAICKEATSLWIPIFSLCYPLLLLYHRKKEAEGNSRWLRFVRRASNIKSHFDSLVNRWWLWPGTRFSRRIRVFPYVPQS